jgi:ribonuclease E
MSELNMPKGMGVIARTAGVGRTTEEMQWDLDYLNQLWEAIVNASKEKPAPFLIYQESDIVIRALRDHYKNEIGEILIDSKSAFTRAHEFMSMVMPNALHKLKYYDDNQPLFNRFQIENQIESAFARTVNLPSGGAIVIDPTEALTSIDINSARATKGGDIEETAMNTNLEAADEIARQLRIRDLGGLLVIDFIDMMKNKNQREVEQRLRRAVHEDRARVQIGRISRFGLLEMSRQRLRPSLGESSQIVCPRCQGQGTIRDIESLSLSVLRLLEEEALKENTGRILTKLPVECATYLLNEKRSKITDIEDRCKVHCVIVPDPNLETPHFSIERVRDNDTQRHESSYKSSYELASEDIPVYTPESRAQSAAPSQIAAVQHVTPPAQKPKPDPVVVEAPKEPGLISKVFSAIFGSSKKEAEEKPEDQNKGNSNRRSNTTNNRNRPRNANANANNQNRNRNRNSNTNRNPNQKNRRDADADTPVNQAETKNAAPQQDTEESRSQSPKPRNNRNRNRNRNSNRRQNSENANDQNTNDGKMQEANAAAQTETNAQSETRERKPASNPTRRRTSAAKRNSGDNANKGETSQQVDAQSTSNSPESAKTPVQGNKKPDAPTQANAVIGNQNIQDNNAQAKTESRPEPEPATVASSENKAAQSVTSETKPQAKPQQVKADSHAENKPVSAAAKPETPAAKESRPAPAAEATTQNLSASTPKDETNTGNKPAPVSSHETGSENKPAPTPAAAEVKTQAAPPQAPAAVQVESKPQPQVSSAPAPKPAANTENKPAQSPVTEAKAQSAPEVVTPVKVESRPQAPIAPVATPKPEIQAAVAPRIETATPAPRPVEMPVKSEDKQAAPAKVVDAQPKSAQGQENPPAA